MDYTEKLTLTLFMKLREKVVRFNLNSKSGFFIRSSSRFRASHLGLTKPGYVEYGFTVTSIKTNENTLATRPRENARNELFSLVFMTLLRVFKVTVFLCLGGRATITKPLALKPP